MQFNHLKIITWNVNGIRAIHKKGNLQDLIEREKPDLLFLQETKAQVKDLSEALTTPNGYETMYHSALKKGYSGTAIWVKEKLFNSESNPVCQKGLEGFYNDDEGRVITYFHKNGQKKYAFISTYMPNGGKSEEAWQDKLIFYKKFLDYVNDLQKKNYVVIWGGDVNCAHQAIDLARPKDNEGKIGFHPLERKALGEFIKNQWLDIWRHLNPRKENVYSWWHLVSRSRERNVGWRIDYLFCHSSFISNVLQIEYLTDQLGSDHCPLLLKIKMD